jgi:BlaI family transcriptional regulator, penicillinase repressor
MSADTSQLSRRERQIMDVVYHHTGGATATQVFEEMTDPPTRTAVRTFLRILEEKGYVEHRKTGREFIYRPTRPRGIEGRSALRHVLDTFFDGSLERAFGAYLHGPGPKPKAEELKRLAAMIKEAKKLGNHGSNSISGLRAKALREHEVR